MPVPSLISDLDTNAANNSPPGTESAKGNIDNYLRAAFAFIKQQNNLLAGATATIASASTVAIGAAAVNNITISGSATITAFDAVADGAIRFVTFSGAATLTHNAASLILPGAANIVTAVNDTAIFKSLGGANWQCLFFQRGNGGAVVTSGVSSVAGRAGAVTLTAADMSFAGADSASVSRTVQEKLRDSVSVFDFMTAAQIAAVKAGWASDAGAIQAAINAVLALPNGGEVVIPEGFFQPSTAVLVPKTTKTLRVTGRGGASQIRLATGPGGTFKLGVGSSATGGVDYVFRDFKICASASSTASGFEAANMNTCTWERVAFDAGLVNGIVLTECYATRFIRCVGVNLTSSFIYSFTKCHNIVLDHCNMYGIGGTAGSVLNIADAMPTNNIVILGGDYESCANIYSIPAGCSSIKVSGAYIEYTVNLEFYHRGICYGVDIDNNWLALNTSGNTLMSGGGISTISNVQGGSFCNNTIASMTVNFDPACQNIDQGGNVLLNGSGYMGPSPFTPVAAFQNGWTQGARQVSYKRQQDGTVELRGCINGTNGGNTAFVLPAGYRPSQQLRIPVVLDTSNIFGAVIVDTNGNVVPIFATGSVVSLDGIRFIAAPQ